MFKKVKRYLGYLTHPIIGEVWELHRVTNERSQDPRYAPYDITPQRLETLIIEYQKKGYEFISIDEVVARLSLPTTHYPLRSTLYTLRANRKFVAITLDDGYRDNFENAYPVFKKYNVPFCIYVTTGYIGGEFLARQDHPATLTKEQLLILDKDPLCTLGAHTVTHPNMTELSLEEQEKEIVGSIRTMEQILGHKVIHLTIPYGAKDDNTMRLIKKEGIIAQVDAWGGPVRMGMDVLRIPRYIVEETKKTV